MCLFITKFFYAISSFDMNIFGLLMGFIGGLIITFFGLPSIAVLSSGMYSEIEITPRIRLYNWLSRIGLILVMMGFLLQLVPSVQSINLS